MSTSRRSNRRRAAPKQSALGQWGLRLLAAPVKLPLSLVRMASLGTASTKRHRRPRAGSRPGTLVVPVDAPRPRIRVFNYSPERVEEHEVTEVGELRELLERQGSTWVDVQGFGDEKILEQLRELFGLHPLAMADIINVPQRPKVEDYGDRHLMITRMARSEPGHEVNLEQVGLVLGPGWLVTFQERPGDVFSAVRDRLRAGAGPIRRLGPDYLAYVLLDAVIDGYFPVVEDLGEGLEHIEEEVMASPSPSTAARIHTCRRMLLALHRVLWRQRDALNAMLRQEDSPFSKPVRIYLRDAYDHALQALDFIESYREMAVSLMDVYLSSVSNRMNQVMKALTIMASLFIPLTFIAGIYGMNFDYMPELRWRWGYFGVWGFMLILAAGLLLWFRRLGWFGQQLARNGETPTDPEDAGRSGQRSIDGQQ